MEIIVLYDNEVWKQGLTPDWGFSCFIKLNEQTIIFDTGADGSILLSNMARLGVDPKETDAIFISHAHWDHTGGLRSLMIINDAPIYVPASSLGGELTRIVGVTETMEILPGVISTGELNGIEQSLMVKTPNGWVVVVGCAHPGVKRILQVASGYGKILALVGGLHGFDELSLLEGVDIICPMHCTLNKALIRKSYPEKYVRGGVGKVLRFDEIIRV